MPSTIVERARCARCGTGAKSLGQVRVDVETAEGCFTTEIVDYCIGCQALIVMQEIPGEVLHT